MTDYRLIRISVLAVAFFLVISGCSGPIQLDATPTTTQSGGLTTTNDRTIEISTISNGTEGSSPTSSGNVPTPNITQITDSESDREQKNYQGNGIIRNITVTQHDEYDQQTIWTTFYPHDGFILIYVYNESTGNVFTINAMTNHTGRIVWEDHRVEMYHVAGDNRELLISGDVLEVGVDWKRDVQLEDVPREAVEREAENVSVVVDYNVSFGDLRISTQNFDSDGLVIAEHWANVSEYPPWYFTGGMVPESFILLPNDFVRVVYVRGDERVYIHQTEPFEDER